MRSDVALRLDATNALILAIGEVEAERFIALIKRDSFDYTQWQRNLWKGKTIDEINQMAINFEKSGALI